MKLTLRSLLALLALSLLPGLPATLFAATKPEPNAKHCGCACCQGKETCCCHEEKTAEPAQPETAKRYPLKGVIVDLLASQTALLVKHEAIPGYMQAMTMLFRVDAATFQAAAKGQAITGTLVEKADGYWLEDVQPVAR